MQYQDLTLTLQVSDTPDTVDVDAIAENAAQVAFRAIAEALDAATGEHTWGDMSPHESAQIHDAFKLFVKAMAVNNAACEVKPLEVEYPYFVTDLDVYVPESLSDTDEVTVSMNERQTLATVRGKTPDAVIAYVRNQWNSGGEDDEWFFTHVVGGMQRTIAAPAAAGPPRVILVHLNVEVPADAPCDAADIEAEVQGALEVGTDDEMTPALNASKWVIALTEEI